MAAGKSVLIRQPMLHGNGNRLLKCEILGQNHDGTLRCKCEGDGPYTPIRNVDAASVIKTEDVYGSFRHGDNIIQKQHSQSPWSLGNLLQKTYTE